jgi:transposase-like protein
VRPYDTLLKAVQDAHVFKRNKRPIESKVVACLLYLSGLSYRAMTYQTEMIDASHASVCRWVHAMRGIVPPRVPRRERKVVAIDETKLKINGRQVYVWAAIDVDTKELLAVYASYYRSNINTMIFLRRVLEMHQQARDSGRRRSVVSLAAE